MKRRYAHAWLESAAVTPDARGEIINALRERDDFPLTMSHCTYLFCFVRDKLKLTGYEYKVAAVELWDEYIKFRKQLLSGDGA